jgi:hypothetical protein
MRSVEWVERAQKEMRERIAARKLERPLSAKEQEKRIRKRRLVQKKAYHAKKNLLRLAEREAASKLKAQKLAAKAERRLLWEQKRAEREAKKTAIRDPVKKLSKQDRAFIEGFEAGKRFALEGLLA